MQEKLTLRSRIRSWLNGGTGPKRPNPPTVIHDVLVGAPPEANVRHATMPKTRQKPTIMAYERQQFRAGFLEPEYNLIEIQKAADTEAYLRLSFDKHEELILKNQWRIVSNNSKALEHVHRRLTEISWAQNQPIEEIVEGGVEDFVELSNAFYVLARKEAGPKYKSRYNRERYPITGIFSPNAGMMKPFVMLGKRGVREIKQWWQMVGGRIRKRFLPKDIVHMTFRRKKGHIFGTPYVVPVLDDILALRRIEELVEILVNKQGFPFFHYKVGTDADPAKEFDNNTSEIDDVKMQIRNMPFEGGLVTSHRHEIVVLGTGKSKVIDASPYLKYFEARVLSGINLSGIDIGRGETANRATAQTMSKGLSDRCMRIQLKFASQFTFFILDELVMELGLLPIPENRAYLMFPVIDTEERRAAENHAQAMYQGGLWTETEARTEMGRDKIQDEERSDMNFARVIKPTAELKAVETGTGMGSAKATANREQPENKSKKLTSKPKVAANDVAKAIVEVWDSLETKAVENLDGPSLVCADMRHEVMLRVDHWLNEGLQQYIDEFNPTRQMYIGGNIKDAFIQDLLTPAFESFVDGMCSMYRTSSAEQGRAIFQALRTSAVLFAETVATQAVYYGYARAAQVDKKKHVRWLVEDNCCVDCLKKAAEPMRIHRFRYGELHHHSSCIKGLVVAEVK